MNDREMNGMWKKVELRRKDTFPSKVDLEHQELLVYGFNNVR